MGEILYVLVLSGCNCLLAIIFGRLGTMLREQIEKGSR
jgi:hypothetical protein